MDWFEVGKRIRKQREAYGFSRETLAERIDVTPKFCSDIELGIKGMSIPTLCKISKVLNLSTDYILFGNTNDNINLISTINHCSPDKLPYLERIIKEFINAMDKQ